MCKVWYSLRMDHTGEPLHRGLMVGEDNASVGDGDADAPPAANAGPARQASGERWPITQTAILSSAASDDTAARNWAHAQFFRLYQAAMFAYCFAATRCRHDADDLTQSFVMDKVIRGGPLAKFKRASDRRLRDFLCLCMRRFLIDRKGRVARGESSTLTLDPQMVERVVSRGYTDPDAAATAEYYLGVVNEGMEQFRDCLLAAGQSGRWELFRRAHLSGPENLTEGMTKQQIAEAAGLRSGHSELQRLRQASARLVVAVLRSHLGPNDDLNEEVRKMQAVFAGLTPR